MKHDKLVKQAARLAEPFCVNKGEKFRLKDFDPADTTGVKSKQHAQNILDAREGVLSHLQEKLYAQDRWAVLVVLQGLDAAGKDGVIKHVMSGVNPQGCSVFSFKSPSTEELDHDYLWRAHKCVPERGRIGIFNRSYYEEVLEILHGRRERTMLLEGLPGSLRRDDSEYGDEARAVVCGSCGQQVVYAADRSFRDYRGARRTPALIPRRGQSKKEGAGGCPEIPHRPEGLSGESAAKGRCHDIWSGLLTLSRGWATRSTTERADRRNKSAKLPNFAENSSRCLEND